MTCSDYIYWESTFFFDKSLTHQTCDVSLIAFEILCFAVGMMSEKVQVNKFGAQSVISARLNCLFLCICFSFVLC